MFKKRRHLWKYGLAGLAVLLLVGASSMLLTIARPSAEAAVREACADTAAVGAFDGTVTTTGEHMSIRINVRMSGDKHHITMHITEEQEGLTGGYEQIYDGQSTRYIRPLMESAEWEAIPVEGGIELPFPYNNDSLCSDVEGATFIGEETLDGVQTRKYKADAPSDGWHIWIDSNGWLVKTEELPSGAEGASEDLPLFVTTYSGIGESNTIVIPTVGQ